MWAGGDDPYQPPRTSASTSWCELLACLVSERNLSGRARERAGEAGVDLDGVLECLQAFCKDRAPRRGV